MKSVCSTEAAKRFGEIAQLAQSQVIEVTAHNRPFVIIMSVEEYTRLRRLDRQAIATSDLPPDIVEAIDHVHDKKS